MKNIFKLLMCSLFIVMLSLPLFGCSDSARQKGGNVNNNTSQNDKKSPEINNDIKKVIEGYISDCYNNVETSVALPDGIALPGSDLIDDVASLNDNEKTNTIRKLIADNNSVEYTKSDISEDEALVEVKISFSYDMVSIEKAMDKACQENEGDISVKNIVSICFDDIVKAIENPGDNPSIESAELKFYLECEETKSSSSSSETEENSPKTTKKWVIKEINK